MVFELFDADMDLRITEGRLPHWFQPGVTYFIAWQYDNDPPRCARSLAAPAATTGSGGMASIRARPVGRPHSTSCPTGSSMEIHATFSREFLAYLDRGHGACLLKSSEFAAVVADSFTISMVSVICSGIS